MRRAAVLALVLSAWSATAEAQEADPQLDLYRRAYEAFQARDYAGSEALLRSALRIGDQNVLHLSLARALLYQGRCQEAVEELTAAESAPAVPTIGPGEVRARAAQYRADVERMCPGTVRVLCSPSDMRIRIGERREETCNSGRVTLPPGDYLVQGRVGGRTVRSSVAVRAMRESTVELLLASTAVDVPEPPPERVGPRPMRTFGWASTLGGAVLLGAAVVLDVVVTADAIDGFRNAAQSGASDAAGKKRDAEAWQTASVIGYVSAGVLVVVGTVALATDSASD